MSNAARLSRMIPYPVIEAAVHGETDAVNEVIRHYSGYIATLCRRTGRDENGNYCTYIDEELDGLFERIYEDNVSGKLSDDRFSKMSRRYE